MWRFFFDMLVEKNFLKGLFRFLKEMFNCFAHVSSNCNELANLR